MKKLITITMVGFITISSYGQFAVVDVPARLQMVQNAWAQYNQFQSSFGELNKMTSWISDTWRKSNETIKTYSRAKEFFTEAAQVATYMGEVQNNIAKDGSFMSQVFKDKSANVQGQVSAIMVDAYERVSMAATTGNTDLGQRLDMVNQGIAKCQQALALINTLRNSVNDNYVQAAYIQNQSNLRKSVYKSFSTSN